MFKIAIFSWKIIMKKNLKILLIWAKLRWEEGYRPKWRPSGAKGLALRDGALAMAAVRIPMTHARFLIECGADPSVHQWLPVRMAAANGDLALLIWLLDQSVPSDYALEDALNWAAGKDRPDAIRLLQHAITSRVNKPLHP